MSRKPGFLATNAASCAALLLCVRCLPILAACCAIGLVILTRCSCVSALRSRSLPILAVDCIAWFLLITCCRRLCSICCCSNSLLLLSSAIIKLNTSLSDAGGSGLIKRNWSVGGGPKSLSL